MSIPLSGWFAHPWALAFLGALPALAALWWWARRKRQLSLALLGNPLAMQSVILLRPGARRWKTLLMFAGLFLLILGMAGPQWGREPQRIRSHGGDLVIALDVSRSMLAEQPSRLERAARALHHLADTLEERGGRRVALVVFAAEAKLWFPLTADYEHLRQVLARIMAEELPTGLRARDTSLSGTRLGAGLKRAVAAQDAERRGGQAVLLLSDGDDPAGDEEWLNGVQAARARGMPIHVVAIGDPNQPHRIPWKSGFLQFEGQEVHSRVNETILKDIARRTDGVYIPHASGILPLGLMLRDVMPTSSGDDEATGEEGAPVYRPRYGWFLWPSLALLALSLGISERPRPLFRRRNVLTALAAILLVSAASPASVDEWLREGNAAFAQGEFAQALAWYQKAEELTADPGLVAFNKAAAFYRLERYREAELHYQRALEDSQIPPARRTRAWFDLGNALVKQAGEENAPLLYRAMTAYRACLAEAEANTDLAKDAGHNLELAALLWQKARAKNPDQPPDGSDPKDDPKSAKGKNSDPSMKEGNGEPSGKEKNGLRPDNKNGKSDKAAPGPLRVLPDEGQLIQLSPEETEAHLDQLAERIRRERMAFLRERDTPSGKVRDW